MGSNAEKLYKRVKEDPECTQALFRKALQDPQGALREICELGDIFGLPVSQEEVKDYLATVDDPETKFWLMKARGGL